MGYIVTTIGPPKASIISLSDLGTTDLVHPESKDLFDQGLPLGEINASEDLENALANGDVAINFDGELITSIELIASGGDLGRTNNNALFQIRSEKAQFGGYASLRSDTGKIPDIQLPESILGQLSFIGVWDPNNNEINGGPSTLPSAATSLRHYYVITNAPSPVSADPNDFVGNSNPRNFLNGDQVISNGTVWQKVDNVRLVQSVNGQIGAVILTTDEIPEGILNLYHTNSRVDGRIPIHSSVVANTAKISFPGFNTLLSDSPTQAATIEAINDSLDTKINLADKGQPNGVPDLDGGGRVPLSQIPTALSGGITYQGLWDAAANIPVLASGVGVGGQFFIVNNPGSTNLDGNSVWNNGDWALFNPILLVWQRIPSANLVVSVNGQIGAVNLTTTNIPEGTNLYYTNARVNANIDVIANTSARHTHANKVVLDAIAEAPLPLSQKGAINGVASLNGLGFLTNSQIPPIAITSTFIVVNQTAMLAVLATTGDLAFRTDTSTVFVLKGSNPGILGNWEEWLYPPAIPGPHTHDATDIITGIFIDARISQSSVTQYTSNIDHDSLLNFDINEHRPINDGSITTTNLWSANKINNEISGTTNTRIASPVDTLVSLKAIDTTNATTHPDKQIINVEQEGIYCLDRDSTATVDGNRIVQPNTGPGRWVKLTSSPIQGGDSSNNEYNTLTNSELTAVQNIDQIFTSIEKTKLSNIESNAKDDQNASEVPFTPAGNISSINVQAAITELDTEKAASVHNHTSSEITDLTTTINNNADVAANTAVRHTHSNKAILDLITSVGSGIIISAAERSNLPTSDQKAALAGTDDVPSVSNKYVTDSDPRLSGGGDSIFCFSFVNDTNGANRWLDHETDDAIKTEALIPWNAELIAITYSNKNANTDVDVDVFTVRNSSGIPFKKISVTNFRSYYDSSFTPVAATAGTKFFVYIRDQGTNPRNTVVQLYFKVTSFTGSSGGNN